MSHIYFYENREGDNVYLTAEDERHLGRVLRVKVGAELTVSDGLGRAYSCKVQELSPLILQITSQLEPRVQRRDVTVCLSLAKGDKISLMVQKCTELGAKNILLFPTKNSDVKAGNIGAKLDRYNRIALEAAKQCYRFTLPNIEFLGNIEQAINRCNEQSREIFVCHEAASDRLTNAGPSKDIALFIGPEGGFDKTELDYMKEHGASLVLISDNILRCETAAVVAVAIVMECAE